MNGDPETLTGDALEDYERRLGLKMAYASRIHWQPMKDAPTDGKTVLIDARGGAREAWYNGRDWRTTNGGYKIEDPWGWLPMPKSGGGPA